MPTQTAYYEEELPADFWDRESAPVADDAPPLDAGASYAATGYDNHPANPASLQEDPRFVALTQLFPGKIIDWQLQDTPKDTAAGDETDELPESDITEDDTEDTLD